MITLFGTATCPACVRARAYLHAKRISFTDRRVDVDVRAAEDAARAALGAGVDPGTVPVLVAGGTVISGFDPAQWDAALRSGLGGLGDTSIAASPVWWALSTASMAASAYHGYKRNNSIGWAIWWGFMGTLFPVITPVIALAQGYGKRAR